MTARVPAEEVKVKEMLNDVVNDVSTGGANDRQCPGYFPCHYPRSLPRQYVADRRPRQADLPRGRDRSRRDLAAEIHCGVLVAARPKLSRHCEAKHADFPPKLTERRRKQSSLSLR